jgi:hypothetical protein
MSLSELHVLHRHEAHDPPAFSAPMHCDEFPTQRQTLSQRSKDLRQRHGGEVITEFAKDDQVEGSLRKRLGNIRLIDAHVRKPGAALARQVNGGGCNIACQERVAAPGERCREHAHGASRLKVRE